MRSSLLGLAVPVLLIAAALAVSFAPPAAAQSTTYTISGRVLSDEGIPLEGVRVNGWTYHEDATRSSTAMNDDDITDADGRYELTLSEGKGSINIYYEKWRQSDYREVALDGDQTLDFTLRTPPPKTAKIVGVVVDAAGNPVPNAIVQLGYGSYGCCYAYAEAMPVPTPAVATTDPATADAPAPSDGGGSTGSAGATEPTPASPSPSPSNTTSASPPPDEKMSPIMPPYPYYDDWAEATTDSEGRFSFEAYAGPRQLTAWAKGFAQTIVQIEAKDGETTQTQIVLEKVPERNAILEGRVVDSRSGLPISGASVNLRSLEWGRYAYAETGGDGTFRIQTVPGWTEISVSWYPRYDYPMPVEGASVDMVIAPRAIEQQYYPYSVIVKLASGDNDQDVQLEAKPKPTNVLTGYVVDPDAKTGVPGARVNVWNQDTGDWGEAVTDETGSYRILVRAGHHTVNAWKDGYLGGTQSFVVDGETERVDVMLPKGTMRYAPCYDDSDCGYGYPMRAMSSNVSYDEKAAEETSMSGSAAPPPAVPTAAPAPALASAEADAAGGSFASGPDTSRAASYSGSGGGLPPYDPNAAPAPEAEPADDEPAPPADDGDAKPGETAPVPGIGVLAALGVLAIGALAMRRRRG